MSKSVVGLFNSTAAAQQVKENLLRQGFSEDHVRVIAQDNQSYAATTGAGTGVGTTRSDVAEETEGGFGATIGHFFRSLTGADERHESTYSESVNRGGAIVAVTTADSQADEVADLLQSYGAEDITDGDYASQTSSPASLASESMGTGRPASDGIASTGTQAFAAAGQVSMPIVEEEMQVGKRQVQRGGVRVYSHVESVPVEENIRLREERVRIDRHPVDRAATEQDFSSFKEGAIELTETGEEAVVSKQARVVEEVVIGKDVSERTETIKDNLRHTEVDTEQLGEVGTKRAKV